MSDLHTALPAPPDPRAQAASVALAVAEQAGVEIRVLGSVREFEAASRLIAQIGAMPTGLNRKRRLNCSAPSRTQATSSLARSTARSWLPSRSPSLGARGR